MASWVHHITKPTANAWMGRFDTWHLKDGQLDESIILRETNFRRVKWI
jgi:hypothetical protein